MFDAKIKLNHKAFSIRYLIEGFIGHLKDANKILTFK
jgi:hypothetical protein